MKIFDRNTNSEIFPRSASHTTGEDRVFDCLARSGTNVISDIIFGYTSRGTIRGIYMRNIKFERCIFNKVLFGNLTNCTFEECEFNNCIFQDLHNISMFCCNGHSTSMFNRTTFSGVCQFSDCYEFEIRDVAFSGQESFTNCPELEVVEKEAKERAIRDQKLRESLKYGYKIVYAPVLVKLSFPEEAQVVNLNEQKSRASIAKVESIQLLNEFGGEGVTNNFQGTKCDYKVGELVYPDKFDPNPNIDCSYGIHFCKDIADLPFITGVDPKNLQHLKIPT